jgi:hypothetical protein
MFFFAFDRVLLDDERAGLKSYQALWMRMQNEIVSSRFNKFSDFYDMDKFADNFYDTGILLEMSARLAGIINRGEGRAEPIDEDAAERLLANSKHTSVSLPRQIVSATVDGWHEDMEVPYDYYE